MREFTNNITLAFILDVSMLLLFGIFEFLTKEHIPAWTYAAVGALNALYAFSRKES